MLGPWGKACEALRQKNHMSKKDVALRAKMTATTYGKIERGHHTYTRKLERIAEVFEVTIDHVLSGGPPRVIYSSDPEGARETQREIAELKYELAQVKALLRAQAQHQKHETLFDKAEREVDKMERREQRAEKGTSPNKKGKRQVKKGLRNRGRRE